MNRCTQASDGAVGLGMLSAPWRPHWQSRALRLILRARSAVASLPVAESGSDSPSLAVTRTRCQ